MKIKVKTRKKIQLTKRENENKKIHLNQVKKEKNNIDENNM